MFISLSPDMGEGHGRTSQAYAALLVLSCKKSNSILCGPTLSDTFG